MGYCRCDAGPQTVQREPGVTDGRKFNRPPPNPKALDAETIAAVDEVIAKGAKQTWVARQLGVHDRTVMAVVNRTGAYVLVPKRNAELCGGT